MLNRFFKVEGAQYICPQFAPAAKCHTAIQTIGRSPIDRLFDWRKVKLLN